MDNERKGGCVSCQHGQRSEIFEMLCKHEQSEYRVGDRVDFHSATHMLEGKCMDACLYIPRRN